MAVGSAENGFARDAAFRSLTNTHGVEATFLALLYDHAGESARTCANEEPRAEQGEAFLVDEIRPWIRPFLRHLEGCAVQRASIQPLSIAPG